MDYLRGHCFCCFESFKMSVSINKSFFGLSVPVWNQGQSQSKALAKGSYKFTFKDVAMNASLVYFIKDKLPFVTELQDNQGKSHTLKVDRIDYNSNSEILEIFLYVTSPPLALILGGIGLLGVGAYTLYRVERVFTLPIWYLGAGLAAIIFLKKR